MFMTYAVRILDGEKHRLFIDTYTTEVEAKIMALWVVIESFFDGFCCGWPDVFLERIIRP
jgi:hypothetical protein